MFFIHSLIHLYLGWFYNLVLWIILKWTWECRVPFRILMSRPLGRYTEVNYWTKYNSHIFKYFGATILFSVLIYIPRNSAQEFPSLYVLTNICYFSFLLIIVIRVNILLWFWLCLPNTVMLSANIHAVHTSVGHLCVFCEGTFIQFFWIFGWIVW